MTVVAHIDRNDPDERTYVAIDQVIGPVVVGEDAMVIERTTGLVGSAKIAGVDPEAKMVVFTVDWDSLKVVLDEPYDPEEGGGTDFESSPERFGGRAQGPGGFRFGAIKSGRPPRTKTGPTVAAQDLAFPTVVTPKDDTPSEAAAPEATTPAHEAPAAATAEAAAATEAAAPETAAAPEAAAPEAAAVTEAAETEVAGDTRLAAAEDSPAAE